MEKSLEHWNLRGRSSGSGKSSSGQEKSFSWRKTSWGSLVGAVGLTLLFAWLFFRNLWGAVLTFPVGVVLYRSREKKQRQLCMEERRKACKDAFLAMASSLSAGYALENAVLQAKRELSQLWGADSDIVWEWEKMERGIRLNQPVEQAFEEFAKRSGLPEVEQLAGLMHIAKRSGGRLGALLQTTASQLEEKAAVEMEIRNRLTEKRLELTIMLLMPPGILVYLQMFSYELIAVLYESLWGRCFMTGCLCFYGIGWWIGQKILDIRM